MTIKELNEMSVDARLDLAIEVSTKLTNVLKEKEIGLGFWWKAIDNLKSQLDLILSKEY